MNIVIPNGQKLDSPKLITKHDFVDNNLNIVVEDNSDITFVDKLDILDSNNPSDLKINLSVGKNSIVKWINLSLNSMKYNLITSLDGERSDFAYKSIIFGRDKQNFDVNVKCIHNAPHSKSDILIKGVVDDESQLNCKGLVRVESNAPHSEGYQKSIILILNDNAHAQSLPELEIENNDVKCTHGATVGKINEESLFYIMSRGLSREEATKNVVEGFLFGVVDSIGDDDVVAKFKDEVNKIICEKYNARK